MKRFFMSFLSIVFPCLVLLIYDDPVGALIALLMQATFIGWIPAIIWARRTIRKNALNMKTNDEDQEA